MSRIRTVKPEFHKHEELSALPAKTHLLACALLNYADDEGFFNANPRLVHAECCPLRDDYRSIPGQLRELSSVGFLRFGKGGDGKLYGWIVKFLEHQSINKPRASKIKELVTVWEDYGKATGGIPEDYHGEWNGMEGNGTKTLGHESEVTRAATPTCAHARGA